MADLPPTVEFKTNIPQEVTFPFGDYKEGDGAHGKWYKHNVNIGGTRMTLFASENLHSKLLVAAPLKGKTLTITKVELDGNKRGWEVVSMGSPAGEPQESPQEPSQDAPGSTTAQTPTSPPDQSEQAIHDAAWRAFMQSLKCHRDAGFVLDLAKPLWAESVRAWAASILIASLDQRSAVRPHPESDGEDPDPHPASTGDDDLPF